MATWVPHTMPCAKVNPLSLVRLMSFASPAQAEHDTKRFVERLQLLMVETAKLAGYRLDVDHTELVSQDVARRAVDVDYGTKCGGGSRARSRRDKHRAECQQIIVLDDHRRPRALLLVPTRAARSPNADHFAAYHQSSGQGGARSSRSAASTAI